MRYLSLFSGIEAASVAWEPLGWEPVAFCEIDAFPSAVLSHHYPNVPNLGDITKVDWNDFKERYGAVDVIVGGSPCQSFSIAGGRAGLDGESRLMFEYIRAVSEIRPTWFLWENVPGVFSTDAGRAFGILLHELEELGYGMAWRVLDAQFFGVAQRRKRVFLVGYLGNVGCAAAVLFEPDSVSGNTLTSREKREELTRTASVCVESGSSPTIAIQGSMLGRSDKNGPQGCGLNEEVSFTLNTVDRHGVICMADDTSNAAVDVNLSGTLKVGGGSPIVSVPYALKIRGGCDTYMKRDGSTGTAGKGALVSEDLAFTVAATQDQTIIDRLEVRRLTPKECERLQGFPDDWTKVPYRGKPAEECPDGARYKACGNSMAVPVMRWIGERIQMVNEIARSVEQV